MAIEIGSIDHLSQIISQVVAPSFVLGAVMGFLSMLHSRLATVLDRIRTLNALPPDDPAQTARREDVVRLRRRVDALRNATLLATGAGVITTILIIVAFASALLRLQHIFGTALLFILSLALFCGALLYLAYDTTISVSEHDHH